MWYIQVISCTFNRIGVIYKGNIGICKGVVDMSMCLFVYVQGSKSGMYVIMQEVCSREYGVSSRD